MTSDESPNERLSQLETWWSVLRRANDTSTEQREQARACLAQRYQAVVRRYLAAAVGSEAADELTQQFAERMMEGRYLNVSETRGRFRDYLKTCLFRMSADHFKRQKRERQLSEDYELTDRATATGLNDQEWCNAWRQDLIDRALEGLARLNQQSNRFLYLVLHLRINHPNVTSQALAKMLSEKTGKTVTDGWLRKKLMLARQRFAELLLEEIVQSVNPPTLERVTDELVDLKLLDYLNDCPAWRSWFNN